MTIAITSDKKSYGYLEAATLSITGAAASTAYVLKVLTPGGHTSLINCTTDGSGAATVQLVAQSRGSFSAELRPAAEHSGQTTAAATLTFKGQ